MGSFYQQLLTILTTPPGNLAYHLVLAFSIAGAFGGAFIRWREGFPPARRMVTGLLLLLLAQLGLSVYAGLSQFFLAPEGLLPTLDRAVSAFSLVLIIWLWAFPEPVRPADAATALLGLLVIALSALSAVWSVSQATAAGFNGSLLDLVWNGFALALIAIGSLMLLVRRPYGFGTGLAALGLLFAGHLAHLLLPISAGDFPGAVRLAQMAAYPLLLTLPLGAPRRLPEAPLASDARNLDPRPFFQSLLAAFTSDSWPEICRAVTSFVCESFPADLCLLVSLEESPEGVPVHCGWDRLRKEEIATQALQPGSLPQLFETLGQDRPLILPSGDLSVDLAMLGQAFDFPPAGPLLAAPLSRPGHTARLALVLLSPHTRTDWTAADRDILLELARQLEKLIERNAQFAGLEEQLAQARQSLLAAQSSGEQSTQSNAALRERMESLQKEAAQERARAESLAALVASQEAAQETILQLQAENERLSRAAASASLREGAVSEDGPALQGELRLALQEIARLREQLAQANAMRQPETTPQEEVHTAAPGEELVSLAEELRQPMSSILGYTDLLLGESVGILGALQRKFLERVKSASERAAGQVEILIRTALRSEHASTSARSAGGLAAAIAKAVEAAGEQLRAREIELHLDLPEDLPPVAGGESLVQALVQLLGLSADLLAGNSAADSPGGESIHLTARVYGADGEHALLQVSTSQNHKSEQAAGEFVWPAPAEEASHLGASGYQDRLSTFKRLVESQGGRVWLESDVDGGAMFSVLLPVIHPRSPAENQVELAG